MNPSELQERKVFLARAKECFREGLYDEALALARERLHQYTSDIDAWLIIAVCWAHSGKLKEASGVLKEIDEIQRGWSRIYTLLGDIYNREALPEEAADFYRKAHNFDRERAVRPEGDDTIAAHEHVYPDGRDKKDDADYIKNISSDFYTITLAELYIKQGHFTVARNVLKRIVKEEPYNIQALERLEFVEASMGAGKGDRQTVIIGELEKWLHGLQKRREV